MTGTKYLSELVDVSLLQQDKLNIIKAPTGSGKTYFALQTIPGLVRDAVHKVVYLIDTVNGKDQIVENYNAVKEYRGWSKDIDGGGIWFYEKNDIVVITYARFGYLLERYPEFYKEFTYIICDELHSLLRFQDFSPRPNCHSEAREGLEKAVKNSSATVIALTATPSTIPQKFDAPYIEIPIDQTELIQYTVKNVVQYHNLNDVLFQVSPGSVGVCYLPRISQMAKFAGEAKRQGFSPIPIWSIRNMDNHMNEEQMAVRESILKEYTIPPQYDLLIINSSCETSIKIKSRVDYVVVDSSNNDTQIQVRGRANNDLDTIFIPGGQIPILNVPEQYLGVKLFTKEKNELLKELDIRNANNRPIGWPKAKEYLLDNDYNIAEGRKDNKRYAVITRGE